MSRSVFYIKLVHSLLLFLIAFCTIYVFIAAVVDHITGLTWFAFGVAAAELLAIAFNEGAARSQTGPKIKVLKMVLLPIFFCPSGCLPGCLEFLE